MPDANEFLLLSTNAVANGNWFTWPGGKGTFSAHATNFNGASCVMQWSDDGGTTAMNVDRTGDSYTTLTANGGGSFELPPCQIRAVTLTAAPTGLIARAERNVG